MFLPRGALLLVCLAGLSHQDDDLQEDATTGGAVEIVAAEAEAPATEDIAVAQEAALTEPQPSEAEQQPSVAGPQPSVAEAQAAPPSAFQQLQGDISRVRSARKRGRRLQRGFFNDGRYRNPSNNPNNPSSPYAFRGRPGHVPQTPPQPQQPPQQQYYDPRYYDPYGQAAHSQYYAYPGYYYNYPQPPQPPQPAPPPTEQIPDLYYLQKPDTPDGQYQYKKVSAIPDIGRRRRPSRWPQNPQPPVYNQQPNYPYAYNPYDPYRRPYYPQEYQYPPQNYQYPPYQYQQPRGPRSPRRFRSGVPPNRPTPDPGAWRLTFAPAHAPAAAPTEPDVATDGPPASTQASDSPTPTDTGE